MSFPHATINPSNPFCARRRLGTGTRRINRVSKPMKSQRLLKVTSLLFLAAIASTSLAADRDSIRVATYNVSLFRDETGQLVRDLAAGDNEQALRIAEVIQRVR